MTLPHRPRVLADLHSMPTPVVAMDRDELLAERFFEQGVAMDRDAGDGDEGEDDRSAMARSLRRRVLADVVAAACAASLAVLLAAVARAL